MHVDIIKNKFKTMKFYINQIFEEVYPPEAAIWCNTNNAHIEKIEGGYKIVENPKPTQDEIIKGYEYAVQRHLDKTAQSKGYDNTYTCLSYLNSTDEKWKTESTIFNSWRDSVWQKCHELLNAFIAGELEQPTIEEVIEALPKIEW